MRQPKSLFGGILCTVALLAAAPAGAALINNHNGSFTDTATGYLWRTLAQYDGMEFDDAAALLPAGYHVSSETELATLTAAAPTAAAGFGALLSSMGAAPDSGMVWGFYGDGKRYAWLADGDTAWNSNTANGFGWTNWNYAVSPDDAFAGLSLFAVNTTPLQAAVPEPGTFLLSGVGLILLGCRLRRSKRTTA
jgi:hypothetical protein